MAPPKGRSKAKANQLKKIGEFSKNSKVLNKMDVKLQEQNQLIELKNSQISKVKSRLQRKKKRLKQLEKEVIEHDLKIQTLLSQSHMKSVFTLSSKKANLRKKAPTSSKTPHTTRVIRREETITVCSLIHGERSPYGMLDCLTSKFKSEDLADQILQSKSSLVKVLESKIMKEKEKDYYNSKKNLLRSLSVYYGHSVMGKAKYICNRKANKNNDHVPNLVTYKVLSDHINSINIGTVRSIKIDFGHDLSDEECGNGMYRPLPEYANRLAQFYLTIYPKRKDNFLEFESFEKKCSESTLFLLNFGGDGAPGSGTAFLVSFVNVGQRLMSSKENFTVFGANCDEKSVAVLRYVKQVLIDFRYLENNIFPINIGENTFKIEFKIAELPNDMKMLCILASELSNSAHYFTTFANVNHDDCDNIKKQIGSKANDWNVFTTQKRISDGIKAAKKSFDLSKSNLAKQTQRNHLTNYIRGMKSRQEDIPLMGEYIERAKSEPLHLKNNIVKELFLKILLVVIAHSDLKNVKTFNEIKESTPLFIFSCFVKSDMGCNFLITKLKQWYNDNGGKVDKNFSFRFRGKESLAFLKKFPLLLKLMINTVNVKQAQDRLYQIFLQFFHLRYIISYTSRIESFNNDLLYKLEVHCKELFKLCVLFDIPSKPSPSLWALCKAVPYHARITLAEYGLGLGVNSMEGREQKHQSISKYANNTTFQNRWPMIFRHEYTQLIYLRENGYDDYKYNKRKSSYLPDTAQGKCLNCGLELLVGNCFFCDGMIVKDILKKIENY